VAVETNGGQSWKMLLAVYTLLIRDASKSSVVLHAEVVSNPSIGG
jgi:hypothetical protein